MRDASDDRWGAWRRALRARHPDVEADVDDELAFHLDMRARDLEARGLAPDAARREAVARFGDVTRVRDALREHDHRRVRAARRRETMQELAQDVRHAARALRRAPGFALAAVLTLALGIGATTAVFSVVHAALLRPLPYPRAERLVDVRETARIGPVTVSPPNFDDARRDSRSLDLAAWSDGSGALAGEGAAAEQVPLGAVTARFFHVLQVAPLVGRTFDDAESMPDGPKAVVLSHALWMRRFGGDPTVVGRTLRLDGVSRQVVGVMPPGFTYPRQAELWVPLAFTAEELSTQRGAHYLRVVGRLRGAATLAAARAELDALGTRLAAAHPRTNTDAGFDVRPLRDALVGNVRHALLVLLGAVALLLLLACANVANLMLVRATRRERERVVRVALGAGRGRLAQGVLAEAVLLALGGGALGVGLAWWGTRALAATLAVARPSLATAGVDAAVLAFALGASMLTAVAFGALPAAGASRLGEIATVLRGASPVRGGRGRGAVAWRGGWRMRGSLVVAQVAITTLLVTGAVLLAASFLRLRRVDLGFEPRGVWTFALSLPDGAYAPPRAAQLYETLLERVRATPGVRAAGATMGLPLSGMLYSISVRELDGVRQDDARSRSTQLRVVTDGFFQAMGMRLVRGRVIEAGDRAGAPSVVVVNEALARMLWPGQDPIGRHFELGTRLGLGAERARVNGIVVGVVADTRDEALAESPAPTAYFAHRQYPVGAMAVVVRGDDAARLARPLAAIVAALAPDVPVHEERAMSTIVADAAAEPRLHAALFGAFAAVALTLAAVGVYGVVALAVGQRTREIGVRVALGARAADVVRLVLRQALAPVAGGLALGIAAAFLGGRLLARLLYGTSATEPAALVGVIALVAAVASLAAWLPTRRAARVAPTVALRAE